MKRRYVIIIGAMKSGTTTLFDVLAQHPAIAPASNKEPGFFAFDEVWNKGFDWFDTLFDFDPARHCYRLEASTDYTKAPFVNGVWERMTANPDVEVKLLYIVRHPLRRIESHARHVQHTRKEIGQQISPITDHSLDEGLSVVNLAVSYYSMQLDAYAEAWSAGQLHCIALEDLQADPEGTLKEIWDFLALPQGVTYQTLPVANAADRVHLDPRFVRLAGIRPLLAVSKAFLPRRLRDKIRATFHRPLRVEGRFLLNEGEAQFLSHAFDNDLDRLARTYGIDVAGRWGLP
jgi:hypothetical protein